jgi:hypothetical protein
MRGKFIAAALIIAVAGSFLAGCPGGGSEDDGGGGSNLSPIADSYVAEDVVRGVANAIEYGVMNQLDNGTFTNVVVNGITGTATVTGYESYTGNQSCGASCIESTYDAIVTIVFNNFKTKGSYTNVEFVLNGTIYYDKYNWSMTSSSGYSSSRSVQITSTGSVQVQEIIDGGSWGYQDTILFDASGTSFDSMSGSCTVSSGITYYF